MLDDDDGRLLLALPGGLARFVDGQLQPAYPSPAAVRPFVATKLLRDRDGGVWMATSGRGIVHFHDGRAERFARGDGLSDDYMTALFEDREGTVWVATSEGLERFRDVRIPTYGLEQGLPNATVTSVLAARDGTIWAGTFDGLARFGRGVVTVFREHHQPTANGIREVTGRDFPDRGVHTLFQDRAGRIWISDRRRVGIVVEDRFVPMLDVGGRNVYSIVQDQRGDVWIATDEVLARIRGDRVVEITPWPTISRHGAAVSVIADVRGAGVWLAFVDGAVAYLAGGRFDTVAESSAVNPSQSRVACGRRRRDLGVDARGPSAGAERHERSDRRRKRPALRGGPVVDRGRERARLAGDAVRSACAWHAATSTRAPTRSSAVETIAARSRS